MKQRILWLLAIALILTSCTVEDRADVTEESPRPMHFTVSLASRTRSAVNDTWDGGEAVAVCVNDVVKKYKIVTGATVTLEPYNESVTPFYWPHNGSTCVTVSAWYPYSTSKQVVANTNINIIDQSTPANYEAANLMEAAEVTKAYNAVDNSFPLTFTHRMAKLIFVPYHSQDTEGQTTTQLNVTEFAKTTVTKVTKLCYEETTAPDPDPPVDPPVSPLIITIPKDITPFKNTSSGQFEVLVAPQAIADNTDLLTLTYTNFEKSHTQTFKYTQATSQILLAGKTYVYRVNFNTAADSSFVVSLTKSAEDATPATYTYDGTEKTPAITVTCNGKTLTQGADYLIDDDNSTLSATEVGTYTISVQGRGQYNPATIASANWEIQTDPPPGD